MTRPSLARSLYEAWLQDAGRALATLNAAAHAPALFKPDAVEQARREYARAMQQAGRGTA
jgi:hypothetical protein